MAEKKRVAVNHSNNTTPEERRAIYEDHQSLKERIQEVPGLRKKIEDLSAENSDLKRTRKKVKRELDHLYLCLSSADNLLSTFARLRAICTGLRDVIKKV